MPIEALRIMEKLEEEEKRRKIVYLRTRTNIYEMVAEFDKTYIVKCRTKSKNGKNRLLSKFEVEKQADTIEELCDEFALIDFDNNKYFKKDYTSPYYKLKFLNKYKAIYGAIWTDKGLIYVAEMIDNGKLELI